MNLNPFAWSFRVQFLTGFLLCASLLAYALYVQHGMLMMPCALCILQRVAFAGMGVAFLVGGLHSPKAPWGRTAYAVLVFLAAAAGAGVAIRHVLLQYAPSDGMPLCASLGLEYMIEAEGLFSALRSALAGSGDCAKIDWTFLGLSMPVWTLVWFVGLGLGALWAGLRKRN
jgi:disulfide bond formation protein DsbB